jgi:hypothetical protein
MIQTSRSTRIAPGTQGHSHQEARSLHDNESAEVGIVRRLAIIFKMMGTGFRLRTYDFTCPEDGWPRPVRLSATCFICSRRSFVLPAMPIAHGEHASERWTRNQDLFGEWVLANPSSAAQYCARMVPAPDCDLDFRPCGATASAPSSPYPCQRSEATNELRPGPKIMRRPATCSALMRQARM